MKHIEILSLSVMQEVLPDRIDRIKKVGCIIALLLALSFLVACSNDGAIEVNKDSELQASPTVEKTEEGVKMEDNSKELLMMALSCGENDADRVLDSLKNTKMVFPLNEVERIEENTNNLRIIDGSSVEYSVIVNKQFYVDMIKDIQADKIIFAVYE